MTASLAPTRLAAHRVRTRFGEVQDLGVKSALFYVLLGARMPAVLVETAFISNPDEERRLNDDAYQDKLADAIVRGIRQYFIKNPPGPKAKLASIA